MLSNPVCFKPFGRACQEVSGATMQGEGRQRGGIKERSGTKARGINT